MQLKGQTSSTCVIAACQCAESRTNAGTVFLQRELYLKKCNISTCPRSHFIQDLVHFIVSILGGNNKVILAVDINEHVIEGNLPTALKRLGLIEDHVKKFNRPGPASHTTGSNPIDRVWVSDDVTPAEVSTFPHKFGAGDYRMILVDFNLDQIIEQGVNTCDPSMKRLICENKKSVESCNQLAWELLKSNKVQQRLEQLETSLASADLERWCVRLKMLDEQITGILLHEEKKCRKLRTGEVEYSPEVSEASERWHAWRMALKVSQGNRTTTRELHRLANKWNMDVSNPRNT